MARHQIERFDVQDAGNNNIVILVSGPQLYKAILERAFAGYYFSRTFDDRYGRFDWGTYVYNIDPPARQPVVDLLDLLTTSIFIEDDLTESFSLDFHTRFVVGGYVRTETGQLVYEAKPYGPGSGSRTKADELADRMLSFTQQHPSYRNADVIVAVPPSNPNKRFDLPTHLVARLSASLGKPNVSNWIRKVRATKPMKDCGTIQEKIDNVRGAFAPTPEAEFPGKKILLVDDIYQSGFTMNEVGRAVFAAGATYVFGLAATKTSKDIG
jgi:hypothetical protein